MKILSISLLVVGSFVVGYATGKNSLIRSYKKQTTHVHHITPEKEVDVVNDLHNSDEKDLRVNKVGEGDFNRPGVELKEYDKISVSYRSSEEEEALFGNEEPEEKEEIDLEDFYYDKDIDEASGIELVSEEEFADCYRYGYEQISWTYYINDNVIHDFWNDEVEDPEELIGEDVLNRFNNIHESEEGSDPIMLFVRNHDLKLDIEIMKETESVEESEKERAERYKRKAQNREM